MLCYTISMKFYRIRVGNGQGGALVAEIDTAKHSEYLTGIYSYLPSTFGIHIMLRALYSSIFADTKGLMNDHGFNGLQTSKRRK